MRGARATDSILCSRSQDLDAGFRRHDSGDVQPPLSAVMPAKAGTQCAFAAGGKPFAQTAPSLCNAACVR